MSKLNEYATIGFDDWSDSSQMYWNWSKPVELPCDEFLLLMYKMLRRYNDAKQLMSHRMDNQIVMPNFYLPQC